MTDLRDALRGLFRQPRFTTAAILILGIGIAMNVTVFALVHTILFQPLPYDRPDQLVRIWEANPSKDITRSRVSRGNFFDWRRESTSFSAIEAFSSARDAMVVLDDDPEMLRSCGGTDGFIRMLAAHPLIARAGSGYLLSYGYWQRRFGADPHVLGRDVAFEGFRDHPVPIAGVMPRGFDFPPGCDTWGTISFGTERGARNVDVVARLKGGVTIAAARAELASVEADLGRRYPVENAGWTVEVERLQDAIAEPVRSTLFLLYVAVSLMTLLTLVNVAVLSAVRGASNAKSFAIRHALGATRRRLVAACAIDAVTLGVGATAGGAMLSFVLIRLVAGFAPGNVPRITELAFTRSTFVAALGIGALAAILLTVIGAIAMDRARIASLRVHGASPRSRMPGALVVVEIAACACLLGVAVHAVRSFLVLEQMPLGINTKHVLTVQIRQPIKKPGEHVKHYPTRRFLSVAERVEDTARALPGVTDAGLSWATPLSRPDRLTTYRVLDHARTGPISDSPPVTGPDARRARLRVVDPGYFSTLELPIVQGRGFTSADRLNQLQIDDRDADRGPGAAIVSESFARWEWPAEPVVGRYLDVDDASYRSVRIVGVVADSANLPGEPAEAVIYLPYAQDPLDGFTLLVRTSTDPAGIVAPLRERLRAFGSDVMAFNVRTLDEVVHTGLAAPRFTSGVMGAFGTIALGLSAVALYSVLALFVALRQREIAIRIAIGAEPRALARWLLGRGVGLAALGTLAGTAASLLLRGIVENGAGNLRTDTVSASLIVPALVLGTSLLAGVVPAVRAMRADPITLLRAE